MSKNTEGRIPWGCIGPVLAAAITAVAGIVIAIIQIDGSKPPSRGTGTPPVHTSGSLAIRLGKYFDLDDGVVLDVSDSRAEIFFGDGYGHYFISPTKPGVQMAVTSSAATSPDQCASEQLRTAEINFSELHVGSTLCVRTDQNRLSAITVTGVPGSNAATATFTISFTTWE